MKKMNKLVMAAILAVAMQGTVLAQSNIVDLDAGTGAKTFSTELVSVNSTVIGPVTPVMDVLNATNEIGVGVSNGWIRLIRYDLGSAIFSTGPGTAALTVTDEGSAAGSQNATVAVIKGGGIDDSFIVYQITATTDLDQNSTVQFNPTGIKFTDKSDKKATLRYRMFETSTAAINAVDTTPSLSDTGAKDYVLLADSLVFNATKNTSTADVTTEYKEFTNDSFITGDYKTTQIGKVGFAAKSNIWNPADNDDAELSDLIDNGADFVVTGLSFGAASNVYLAGDDKCSTSGKLDGTKSTTSQIYTIGIDTLITANTDINRGICYVATGDDKIDKQTFDVDLDVNSTKDIGSFDTLPLGTFLQDGTVLRAPFIEGQKDQYSYVQLANMGSLNATYSVTCFGEAGKDENNPIGNLEKGKTVKLYLNGLGCDAAIKPKAVEFTLNVPTGNVVGSFVRTHTTTGDSAVDSLTGNSNGQEATFVLK